MKKIIEIPQEAFDYLAHAIDELEGQYPQDVRSALEDVLCTREILEGLLDRTEEIPMHVFGEELPED